MPTPLTATAADTDCQLVASVRPIETPMITELVAAMFHLERLAQTAGTPEQETAAHPHVTTAAQHRSYVLANADRIRRALDTITAPYQHADARRERRPLCNAEAPTPSVWPTCYLPVHGEEVDHETVSGRRWRS